LGEIVRSFYRTPLAATAMLVLSCSTGLGAPNPLLGTWKVENLGAHRNSDGFDYCSANPAFTFTPTTEIMSGPASPGQAPPQGKNDVTYLVSGNTIYVSSSPGFVGAPNYTMLNANEMQAGQIGNCRYRRQ
jgi:Lipocalin-like domain